ncbi:hypothetical protein IPM65_01970 [Candidatus Roizmanbacteria bacterium]|nr:MAG: hypothetical protein IPM65_01970 [Candidatus Roizmanbacteria bacterium]
MKQAIFTIAIILVIVGLLTAVVLGSKGRKADTQATQQPSGAASSATPALSIQMPIFFYGNTCPHCADVEKWMQENKIEEKIEVVKKEVYDNRANSLELSQAAESCGLDTSSIGVPFLFTPEGKCLIGTPDIVGYLSDKAGLSGSNEATESGKEAE